MSESWILLIIITTFLECVLNFSEPGKSTKLSINLVLGKFKWIWIVGEIKNLNFPAGRTWIWLYRGKITKCFYIIMYCSIQASTHTVHLGYLSGLRSLHTCRLVHLKWLILYSIIYKYMYMHTLYARAVEAGGHLLPQNSRCRG